MATEAFPFVYLVDRGINVGCAGCTAVLALRAWQVPSEGYFPHFQCYITYNSCHMDVTEARTETNSYLAVITLVISPSAPAS